MGRKLDLSGLTAYEAAHVLKVVQRDMRLRKKEEEHLSKLKQELDEEDSRCLLLSQQSCFNQRCCIRCCSPFIFLLNPKRQCCDCHYNVCKACRVYNKQDKTWLCSACQKSRLLNTQSLEWFYTNVKKRFKRFGSAKVLKTLYRKNLVEHKGLSELTDKELQLLSLLKISLKLQLPPAAPHPPLQLLSPLKISLKLQLPPAAPHPPLQLPALKYGLQQVKDQV